MFLAGLYQTDEHCNPAEQDPWNNRRDMTITADKKIIHKSSRQPTRYPSMDLLLLWYMRRPGGWDDSPITWLLRIWLDLIIKLKGSSQRPPVPLLHGIDAHTGKTLHEPDVNTEKHHHAKMPLLQDWPQIHVRRVICRLLRRREVDVSAIMVFICLGGEEARNVTPIWYPSNGLIWRFSLMGVTPGALLT